jgi:hypothetical protein
MSSIALEPKKWAQIEKRVRLLEAKVRSLSPGKSHKARRWYITHAGRFANDPDFDEILKLGRAYRRSLGPPHSVKRR